MLDPDDGGGGDGVDGVGEGDDGGVDAGGRVGVGDHLAGAGDSVPERPGVADVGPAPHARPQGDGFAGGLRPIVQGVHSCGHPRVVDVPLVGEVPFVPEGDVDGLVGVVAQGDADLLPGLIRPRSQVLHQRHELLILGIAAAGGDPDGVAVVGLRVPLVLPEDQFAVDGRREQRRHQPGIVHPEQVVVEYAGRAAADPALGIVPAVVVASLVEGGEQPPLGRERTLKVGVHQRDTDGHVHGDGDGGGEEVDRVPGGDDGGVPPHGRVGVGDHPPGGGDPVSERPGVIDVGARLHRRREVGRRPEDRRLVRDRRQAGDGLVGGDVQVLLVVLLVEVHLAGGHLDAARQLAGGGERDVHPDHDVGRGLVGEGAQVAGDLRFGHGAGALVRRDGRRRHHRGQREGQDRRRRLGGAGVGDDDGVGEGTAGDGRVGGAELAHGEVGYSVSLVNHHVEGAVGAVVAGLVLRLHAQDVVARRGEGGRKGPLGAAQRGLLDVDLVLRIADPYPDLLDAVPVADGAGEDGGGVEDVGVLRGVEDVQRGRDDVHQHEPLHRRGPVAHAVEAVEGEGLPGAVSGAVDGQRDVPGAGGRIARRDLGAGAFPALFTLLRGADLHPPGPPVVLDRAGEVRLLRHQEPVVEEGQRLVVEGDGGRDGVHREGDPVGPVADVVEPVPGAGADLDGRPVRRAARIPDALPLPVVRRVVGAEEGGGGEGALDLQFDRRHAGGIDDGAAYGVGVRREVVHRRLDGQAHRRGGVDVVLDPEPVELAVGRVGHHRVHLGRFPVQQGVDDPPELDGPADPGQGEDLGAAAR